MSRASRLLDLIQAFRRRRRLVTAAELADDLGVSVRTIYRDMATLASLGLPVRGEAGVGYALAPGVFLPPLNLGDDELDALLLGLTWVERKADARLAAAATDALAKLTAVLPDDARDSAEVAGVLVGPDKIMPEGPVAVDLLRAAVRSKSRLMIAYRDEAGRRTERTVWPVALAFAEDARLLVAWCELRGGFRHFRLDRIESACTGDRYPEPRRTLLARWHAHIAAEELLTETVATTA